MENKENKEISIDVFSVLTSAGWFLMIANIAGITQLSWTAILNYWLALFGIGLIMGIVTALIGWASKVGGHSAK